MKKRDIFTEFSSLMAHTVCPACESASLEFRLRCDLSYGPCLYTAHCRVCGTSYEIQVTAEVSPGHVSRDKSNCVCHGSSACAPSLSCDLDTRLCKYVGQCSKCAPDAA